MEGAGAGSPCCSVVKAIKWDHRRCMQGGKQNALAAASDCHTRMFPFEKSSRGNLQDKNIPVFFPSHTPEAWEVFPPTW